MGTFQEQASPVPPNDAARCRALEALGILDTPPEPSFDDITALVAAMFKAPMALVTFVDDRRQWFKSRVGIDLPETPRHIAFCAHTVLGDDLFVVDDARRDPRFHDNPLVVGEPNIRFYAGAPLRLPSGHVVGSLAVLDRVPRVLDAGERALLERFARLTVDAIALRNRTAAALAETSRSRADERDALDRLYRSEVRYRRLFQSDVLGILVWDESGMVVEANDAFLAMIGRSREDLEAGRVSWLAMTPPELREADHQRFAEARATRRLAAYEKEYVLEDGRRLPVLIGGAMLDGQESERGVCFVLDLSDRKQVAREVARRAAIVDAALAAIFLIDQQGHIVEANPSAARLFARPRAELVGGSLGDLLVVPSLNADPAASLAAELAEGTAPCFRRPTELAARRQDEVFPVEVAVARVPEEPPGYVAFVRDLTERHQLETQLREAQKLEAVGRLAGGIAHDFNNLLSVVLVVGQLAQKKLGPDDPLRADLEAIVQGARRATTMTRQLLAIGRQQVLQSVPVDVDALVADVEELLRRLVGTEVGLVVELEPDLPPVTGDPAQLQRVLLNLVVNARDATPAGGLITVRTGYETIGDAEARVRGAAPGGYVVLSVQDTGVGMDAETRDRIFEPFFTTKEAGQGTGLGLAIVAGIVKQSGGHLAVESALGRGSTFSVRLPPAAAGKVS